MVLLYRMYVFGLMGSVIAVTAFRRGERWAWWTLLVANAVALVSAMTYDKTVSAIGPFELTEYLGLALVCGALAITAPFGRPHLLFDADQRRTCAVADTRREG